LPYSDRSRLRISWSTEAPTVVKNLPQSIAQGEGIDEKLCQWQTSKNYPAEAPEGDSNGDRSPLCYGGDRALEN
jgi:hypothetical protein